jgi:hypothetical protein
MLDLQTAAAKATAVEAAAYAAVASVESQNVRLQFAAAAISITSAYLQSATIYFKP